MIAPNDYLPFEKLCSSCGAELTTQEYSRKLAEQKLAEQRKDPDDDDCGDDTEEYGEPVGRSA